MLCLCSKTYCCYDVASNQFKFSGKCLDKRVLEQSGDDPLDKYRRVLYEKGKSTATDRAFRTNNHTIVTYKRVNKRISYFYPTRLVESDGIHI